MDRELNWNDAIENDSSDWVLLPAGEYPFRVVALEKKRFAGSAKLPPCYCAALEIEVGDAEQVTTVKHNLYLHTKTEGLLCAFFRAIGMRKHGERFVPDWSKVIGANGWCKVKIRDWQSKDGATKQSSEIEKFLDPADAPEQAAAAEDAPW